MKEFSKEELEAVVGASSSFRDIAKKLGFPGRHQVLKKQIVSYGISTDHFQHGKRYDAMIGQKYGMLTVCAITPLNDARRRCEAKCSCDCGKTKIVRCDCLKDGSYVSCGCHSKNRWNMVCGKNPAFKGCGGLRKTHWRVILQNANKRNIPVDLSIEEAWSVFEQQKGKCALTGLPIQFGRIRKHHETSASLDRIDSGKGYVVTNIQWVLKDINMLKNKYDNEYFIRLCNAVARTHPRILETK